jgi:hypothetical protein
VRRLIAFAVIALGLILASCAVPLGPGFYRHKEVIEARYVPGPDARVEIRSTMEIENSGNRALEFIDVALPEARSFARSDVEIDFGGLPFHREAPQGNPPGLAQREVIRLRFTSPWPMKAKTSVGISYALRGSVDPPNGVGVGSKTFFLDANWYPVLLAPEGLFAKGEARPKKWELRVVVPQGYHVQASGKPKGTGRRGSESELRFQFEENDFLPYVAGGDYLEHRYQEKGRVILVWTFETIPQSALEQTGKRLSAALNFYESAFGSWSLRRDPVLVAESEVQESTRFPPLPGSVFLGRGGLGREADSGPPAVERLLSRTWTRRVAQPVDASACALADALSSHMVDMAQDRDANSGARSERIAETVVAYDSLRAIAAEKPLPSLTADSSPHEHALAQTKSELLIFALREETGQEKLDRAIRRMLQGLRGSTYGWVDLRVAVEAETGRDMGEFFRRWLNEPGIPENFRKRYEVKKD